MIGILVFAALQVQAAGPRVETHGSCSPAVLDIKGNVTIVCHGVDRAAMQRLERVPALLEQLIKQQVNSAELRARLDEIAGAVAPAPTDPFHIYVIHENQDRLTIDTYTFPYRDIPSSLTDFRHALLAQLPAPIAETSDVLILRWRDEQEVSASLAPTFAGNTAVLVLPRSVLARFGDQHLAFTYLKSQIEARPQ